MTCTDFCTAVKCEELEQKIRSLESTIQSLQSRIQLLDLRLEGHIIQPIPNAHEYEPVVTVDVAINQNPETTENELKVDVTIDNISAFDSAILPTNKIDFLDLRFLDSGNNNFLLELYLNDLVASTELQIPEPPISLDVLELEPNQYSISMTVGTQQAQDSFSITLPENNQHVVSNLNISGSYYNDYLTLTIADGESSDTAQIFIDATVINDFGGGGQVECDLSPVLAAISNLSNQLVATETLLSTENQEIKNEITIDITSTVNTDYKCELLTSDSNSNDSTSNISDKNLFTEITVTNKGLLGIHENLKTINTNLDSIFATVCQDRIPGDVVSLVPQAKYLAKADGKYLVLQFVTLDNYPQRPSSSSYWEITIPAAKESYNWEQDFEPLRWQRGNQYAELRFQEFKNPVSGFFRDETAANSYFDAVLNLTTGTQANRVMSKHSNPKLSIILRETRPYRAFIESVNPQGEIICHVKYAPPLATQNNGN